MPLRDGTGPAGEGTRTGRGAGNCAGQGGAGRFGGRGLGMRRGGRGRGFGFGSGQDRPWPEQQVKSLQAALQSIAERLDNLTKE